jgi:hypothetical protein
MNWSKIVLKYKYSVKFLNIKVTLHIGKEKHQKPGKVVQLYEHEIHTKETQTENNLLCVLPQDLQLQVSHEKPSGKPKSIDMLQNT